MYVGMLSLMMRTEQILHANGTIGRVRMLLLFLLPLPLLFLLLYDVARATDRPFCLTPGSDQLAPCGHG